MSQRARRSPSVPLPQWVTAGPAANGVHTREGAYSVAENCFKARSTLAVYQRQYFPDPILGEKNGRPASLILETDAVRMWHTGDDIAIVSFKSKQNTVGEDVLDGLLAAITEAEKNWRGLVIWQTREPFSLGANLASFVPAVQSGAWDTVDAIVAKFQRTTQRLKYSLIPTVAAVRGMALGGGCEIAMHCDRVVAALESYIGLVEAGVGLLPAGGGSKEIVVRCAQAASRGAVGSQIDQLPFVRTYFQQVAMAAVSKSAVDAKALGLLKPSDIVVFNAYELLWVAKAQVRALAESGYRPPPPVRNIPVVGRTGIGTLELMLVNMRDGGFISPHDFVVGLAIARVLCGGDIDAGSLVDEHWLLELEAARVHDAAEDREDTGTRGTHLENGQTATQLGTSHGQTTPGRIHRRGNAHAGRQGAARRLALHAPRYDAGARSQKCAGAGAATRCGAHRGRHHRLRHAGVRAGHECRAHRPAARRVAQLGCGRDHQSVLRFRIEREGIDRRRPYPHRQSQISSSPAVPRA